MPEDVQAATAAALQEELHDRLQRLVNPVVDPGLWTLGRWVCEKLAELYAQRVVREEPT